MKKQSVLTILLALCLQFSFGQIATDSISIKKVFGGYKFYQSEKRLSMNELVNTLKPNDNAYKEIKAARTANIFATILGSAGGFLVGWPIGTAAGGGDPEWVMAGIGAGLIVATIPLTIKLNKHSKKAIGIFNNGLKATSFWDKNELRLSAAINQIGLTLKF